MLYVKHEDRGPRMYLSGKISTVVRQGLASVTQSDVNLL